MRDDTRIDWHKKIDEALIKLLDSVDNPPDFRRIAVEVASSPYHFHKKFKDLTGETFKACADRLRLEKAAAMLREPGSSVTETAFECGFGSVEMLSKAVKKAYGLTPSRLKKQALWHPLIPSSVGVHYSGKNGRKTWFYAQGGKETMETKITHFDEKIFYGYEITGDYWQLPKAWEKFMDTLGRNDLHGAGKEFMSVFPDADDAIPQGNKKALAGFVTEKKLKDSLDFQRAVIPAGLYAVTVHFGSSEAIGPVWDRWMREWLPGSGWEPDFTRPNYEWYQNRLDNPELLLTFLVTSVKRKA
jgi:AraC family transcriptional regulator